MPPALITPTCPVCSLSRTGRSLLGVGLHRLERRRGDRCRTGGVLADEHQADLAALVDVGDLDLELVADLHDVLDLADALALAELADVHQTVAAREQRDERAE